MSNRIIARISKENQAHAVIERAKQRFTSLQNVHDLSRLKTVMLDFASKDDNFITILKSDDFPEVIGAIWDREITIDPAGQEQGGVQFCPEEVLEDLANNPPTSTLQNRNDIAASLVAEGDTTESLAQQIKPLDYGNVIPYTVGAGTQYGVTLTVTNTSYGPKFYINGSFQNPEINYIMPGHVLNIDCSSASLFNYTWHSRRPQMELTTEALNTLLVCLVLVLLVLLGRG